MGEDVPWASRLTPVGDEAVGTGRRGRRPEDLGARQTGDPLTHTSVGGRGLFQGLSVLILPPIIPLNPLCLVF